MQIVALLVALIAIVLLAAEWARTHSLGWAGLAFLAAAWIIQLVYVSGNHVTVK